MIGTVLWVENALDSMIAYHKSIHDLVLIVPPGKVPLTQLDTKYGMLDVWENAFMPPDKMYIMNKSNTPDPMSGMW